ncbi:MAG: TonB-dependent receptor [Pseudomonadaceae bacterium]|nr:MAG: TonB-dependent receptor [Pseudomonadaceae bacterium]
MLPKKSLIAVISLTTSLPLMALEDLLSEATDLPTVLSATRLKQAPAEVPGSMTILDRNLIRASGARDIPELLRLVPGMKVGYRRGHQANVNYHGLNITEARRMQVLIDGRSVYRPGLATVDWTDIPLAIEDIERIEVFRGPNTAAYGANALMGVINIISTDPSAYHGTRVKVTQGRRNVNDFYANQHIHLDNTHSRLSIFGKEDTGFDFARDGADYRNGRRLSAFNLFTSTELNSQQSLRWQIGAKEGSNQHWYDYAPLAQTPSGGAVLPLDVAIANHQPPSDTKAKDYFAHLHWTHNINNHNKLEISTYAQHMERLKDWRACDTPIAFSSEMRTLYDAEPEIARRMNNFLRGSWSETRYRNLINSVDPALMPVADQAIALHRAAQNDEPVCWSINQNLRETRYQIEIQQTLQLTDNLRTVYGAALRHDQTKSQTLLGGRINNNINQVFGNIEYRPHARWLLHAAGMAEDDRQSGFSFSPRVAAHFFVRPSHSVRLVYSEAVRSPDMFENKADWTYPPYNVSGAAIDTDTFYAQANGPRNLQQEEIQSTELGYNGHFHNLGLSIDIRAFYEEIDKLISEPLQVINFVTTNDNMARFTGAETQLDWQATSNQRLRATYAYVDFVATRRQDQRLTSRHSGSAGWISNWNNQLETSLFYYGAQKLNERRFERLDTRIARDFRLNQRSSLELAFVWQHRLDDMPLTWDENNFKSRNYYQLSAGLSF